MPMRWLASETRDRAARVAAPLAFTCAGLLACSSGALPKEYQSGAGDDAGSGADSSTDTGTPPADTDGAVGPADAASSDDAEAAAAGDAAPMACSPALPPVTAQTEYLCTPGAGGKCDNCGDCTMAMNGTAKSQVSSCGVSCVGQSDSCVTSCLSGKSPTLSSSCQTCMVGLFDCTTKYCAGPCVTGSAAQCSACLKANPAPGPTSCDAVFLQCAGLTDNPGYTG